MEPYEYLPPHLGPKKSTYKPDSSQPSKSRKQWLVVLPYGSETIRREVWSESATKALNSVVMGLCKSLNLQPKIVFARIHAEKRYKVSPIQSSFMVRASSSRMDSDLERIRKLPLVHSLQVTEKSTSKATYKVFLKQNNTLVDTRTLTGQLQNLFGGRLLFSSPSEESTPAGKFSTVTVGVSFLEVV